MISIFFAKLIQHSISPSGDLEHHNLAASFLRFQKGNPSASDVDADVDGEVLLTLPFHARGPRNLAPARQGVFLRFVFFGGEVGGGEGTGNTSYTSQELSAERVFLIFTTIGLSRAPLGGVAMGFSAVVDPREKRREKRRWEPPWRRLNRRGSSPQKKAKWR